MKGRRVQARIANTENHLKAKNMNRLKYIVLLLSMIVLPWHPELCRNLGAESDPFPAPESIQPNVNFWKKIYSEYSTRQGVLHDSKNLRIIYDVIDLRDPNQPSGRRINRNRIKVAKSKYRSILKKLGQDGKAMASQPEEQRVAEMFGPDAKRADFQNATRRIRCQVGQKDRFRKGIIRSGAYLEEIRKILRYHGLPEDLAYLPHVESSFNPAAYSKFGAAGAWQFTRSTGRQYMTINYTIDERRDPIRASHAAARLLKNNYDKLKSWPLAMTAYNHGLSGMLRAQGKHGSYEEVFKKYRSRTFKFASRNFYSEFLAARAVADNYQNYFGVLTLNVPTKTTEVTLPEYTSIPQLAQQLDLDLDTLHRLNPALRKPVFTGRKYAPKGYRLRLPADDHRDWKDMMASVSEEIYKPDQKHSRLYQVDRGDTAGKIARLHGVRLRDLIAFNNLDTRATIYVGQNLRIPVPEDKTQMIAGLKSPQKTKIDQVVVAKTDQTEKPPIKSKPNSANESQRVPEIKSHRSASPIDAIKTEPAVPVNPVFGLAYSETATDNRKDDISNLIQASQVTGAVQTFASDSETGNMVASEIDPQPVSGVVETTTDRYVPPVLQASVTVEGQELTPLTGPEPGPDMVTGSFTVENVIQYRNQPVGIILVEIEETLGHYAEWAGVRARDLRRLNNMRYGQPIRLGQKLKIPLHRVTKEAFEETRFEYHKEMAEDFFAAYRIDTVQFYSIKKGDNIWTLSREEFDLPLWLIRRYNSNVDLTSLMPSQDLRIPVVERTI